MRLRPLRPRHEAMWSVAASRRNTETHTVRRPKPTADANESVKMGGFKPQPPLSASAPAP